MKKKKLTPLTGKQKKFLRGLSHHLDQNVILGKEGLTDNLITSCQEAIQAHELVKIKLGQNCPLPRKEAAEALAERTGTHLIQLIGKTVVLYRPNPELPPTKAIELPRK